MKEDSVLLMHGVTMKFKLCSIFRGGVSRDLPVYNAYEDGTEGVFRNVGT